jgi:hypothetical protein
MGLTRLVLVNVTCAEYVFVTLGIEHAHAPYCLLWPAGLCSIFSHYLFNGTIFEEMSLNIKYVF